MKNLVLLGFYILSLIQCKGQPPEKSIVLLQEGFTGPVAIIFNQKDGLEPSIEDGKKVYEIPKSGILRTVIETNLRTNGNEYYYVNKNGERTLIKYLLPRGLENVGGTLSDTSLNENENYVACEEMSGLNDGSSVRLFIVGKINEMEKLNREKEKLLFKLN
ncbi:MAG: hypothetical protein IPO83_03265 [Chitinophagaceae bacterium]|nr:hypothetical protein [Chitinophagaceae bacterium]